MSNIITQPPSKQIKPGDLDPSFGTGGIVEINGPPAVPTSMFLHAVAPDPASGSEQKIYAACGHPYHYRSMTGWIVRLRGDGSLDESYGDGGYALLPEFPNHFLATAIGFLESGSIVIYGAQWGVPAAACLTPEGRIDATFGDNGVMLYGFALPTSMERTLRSGIEDAPTRDFNSRPTPVSSNSAQLDDRKLLFVTPTQNGSYILKITADGALDSNYGEGGVVLIEDNTASPTRYPACQHFDIDPQGGIFVVGTSGGGSEDALVARYDALGHLNSNFGGNGIVHISNPSGFGTHMSGVKAAEYDKVIVLASFFVTSGAEQPSVIKLMPSGVFDPDFNGGQPATTPHRHPVLGMAVDAGRRILIAGGTSSVAYVYRFGANGILDAEYGVGGVVEEQEFFSIDQGSIQSNVKFLGVASAENQGSYFPDQYLIRLLG